jgi:hypothetical protein
MWFPKLQTQGSKNLPALQENLKLPMSYQSHTIHFKIHFENTPWCSVFKNKCMISPSLREMIQGPQIGDTVGAFPEC